jgi:hypothetical protein
MIRSSILPSALGLLLLGAVSLPASAALVTFSGVGTNPNSGLGLAASASFFQAAPGGNLTVTLTNTSLSDVLVPTDVLTAVFFTLSGNPSLTPVSAVLAPGSTVFYDLQGQPAGGVVGGEWAYKPAAAPTPGGISSSGLGVFGPGNLFPGPDLEPPTSPDGVQYGLLSAGDLAATGNSGVLNSGGLIKNSVIFTLAASNFTLSNSSVSGASFQYGTALSEPNIAGTQTPSAVPLPAAAWLLGSGILALGLVRRKARARGTDDADVRLPAA